MHKLSLVIGTLLLSACTHHTPASKASIKGDVRAKAVKWVSSSPEYVALTRQIYRHTIRQYDDIMQTATCHPNCAVVMDVDETVLNNIGYAHFQIATEIPYSSASWDDWVFKQQATLVPGVKAFIQHVHRTGTAIVFISNRKTRHVDATIENLQPFGIHVAKERYYFKTNTSDKVVRRNLVRKLYTPVMYVGDQMGDFPNTDEAMNEGKAAVVVLPNPIYGKWER